MIVLFVEQQFANERSDRVDQEDRVELAEKQQNGVECRVVTNVIWFETIAENLIEDFNDVTFKTGILEVETVYPTC